MPSNSGSRRGKEDSHIEVWGWGGNIQPFLSFVLCPPAPLPPGNPAVVATMAVVAVSAYGHLKLQFILRITSTYTETVSNNAVIFAFNNPSSRENPH